jgi:hypothetical protein
MPGIRAFLLLITLLFAMVSFIFFHLHPYLLKLKNITSSKLILSYHEGEKLSNIKLP